MAVRGNVWKYGDNVNTDLIYPGRYTKLIDRSEMAEHAMEDLDQTFAKNVRKGDIIIAGKNFGSGSSREQAVICLKTAGVGAIVAESFARIFYRNAINLGLPVVICPGICEKVERGQTIEVDFEKGIVKNMNTGETIMGDAMPEFLLQIIRDGGLIEHMKKMMMRKSANRLMK